MRKKVIFNCIAIFSLLVLVFGQFIMIITVDAFQISTNERFYEIAKVVLFAYTAMLMLYMMIVYSMDVRNNKVHCSLQKIKNNIYFLVGTEMFIVMISYLLVLINNNTIEFSISPFLIELFSMFYVIIMIGSFGFGYAKRDRNDKKSMK